MSKESQRFREERNLLLKHLLETLDAEGRLVLPNQSSVADVHLESVKITPDWIQNVTKGSPISLTDPALFAPVQETPPRSPRDSPLLKFNFPMFKITSSSSDDVSSNSKVESQLVDSSGRVHHPKVHCDGCGVTPIVGNRYRCLNCPNFNLCENCEKKLGSVHPTSHVFLKIRIPIANNKKFKQYSFGVPPTIDGNEHAGVICTECGQSPIVGLRYRCWNCSTELCQRCEKKATKGGHDPAHFFMCITMPVSPFAILPVLDDTDMLVPLIAPSLVSVTEQKVKSSSNESISSETSGVQPEADQTDQAQQSILWPKPQEFVIGSYELLLLCIEHVSKLTSEQDKELFEDIRKRINIEETEHHQLLANLTVNTQPSVEALSTINFRLWLLRAHVDPDHFEGPATDYLKWQRRQVAILYSSLRCFIMTAKLKFIVIHSKRKRVGKVLKEMEQELKQILRVTRKQVKRERGALSPRMEEDDYGKDDEEDDSIEDDIGGEKYSAGSLLKAFESNYIAPLLSEIQQTGMVLAKSSTTGEVLLHYPYPIANEFYEILLSAIYFDASGQPILQEEKQIHLLEYLDRGLRISQHIHKISLFRVSFKLYQDFPSRESLQRIWDIIVSEVVHQDLSTQLVETENSYQMITFKEFDSWITEPTNFTTVPALEEMLLLVAIHYHINRWIQSHQEDPEAKNDILNVAKVLSFFAQQYYTKLVSPFKDLTSERQLFPTTKAFLEFINVFEESNYRILTILSDELKLDPIVQQLILYELSHVFQADLASLFDVGQNAIIRSITKDPKQIPLLKTRLEKYLAFLDQNEVQRNFSDFSTYLSPVICAYAQQQEELLADRITNAVRNEEWKPLADDSKHSHSVQQLLDGIQQLLPVVFAFAFEVADIREFFIGTMIGCLGRAITFYVSTIVESCGNREDFMPTKCSELPPDEGWLSTVTTKKKPSIEPIPVHVWNRLTRQKLEHLCVRMNNLYFARHTVDFVKKEFRDNTRYFTEGYTIKPMYEDSVWDSRFKSVRDTVEQGLSTVVQYIATKVLFVDLRTPLIEELYVPVASQARLERVLKLFDPVLNAALKSMVSSERIKTEFMTCVLRSFVEALEFILLYGGTGRNFNLDDAELFVEDILILRDVFTGKRKSSVERPALSPQLVNSQTEHLKQLATNTLALQTDYLIKQYGASPLLEHEDSQSSFSTFSKWNILSILIHRNDKEARKFVRSLKDTPLYQHLRKGTKKELENAITTGSLSEETASKPPVTTQQTATSTSAASTFDSFLTKLETNFKNI